MNVKYFAAGNGITDDTAAINLAMATASALGLPVFFPAGVYCVTSLNPIPANLRLYGFDEHLTVIKTTSATADVITVASANVKIWGIGFDASVTRTAGRFVRVTTGAFDFKLSDFRMHNAFIGFSIEEGTAIIKVRDGYITDVRPSGIGGKIGEGTGVGAFAVELSGVTINCLAAPNSTSLVVVNVADLILLNVQLLDSTQNLVLAPGVGQSITSLKVLGGYIDTAALNSMAFVPSGSGIIQKVDFTGVWFQGGPATANVILFDTGVGSSVIDGVTFSNCEAYNSVGAGLSIVGHVRNLSWLGGKIAACQYGVYISTASGFDHIAVKDARIGAIAPYGGNGTGIRIDNSGDFILIDGNDLVGNVIPLTNNNTSTHNRITNNAGFNDVVTMTTLSGASPYTLPTFPYPTVVYINAGTVSLITVNGAGILQSTNHSICRPPNSTMVVTYSSAPSIVSVAA